MYDVFISYSRRDSDFVNKVVKYFDRENIKYYRDTKDLPPAVIWRDELKDAIIDADNLIFIISPDSISSKYCKIELEFADECKKRLIPVVCRTADKRKIPKSLSKWQFLRIDEDDDDKLFRKILKVIQKEQEWYNQGTDYLRRAENRNADPETSGFLAREELAAARQWIEKGSKMEQGPLDLQIRYIQESEAFHLKEAERLQELYSKALARQLAAQAEVMIDQRGSLLELGTLLAVESMRRLPTLEGDHAIRKALFLLPKKISKVDFRKKHKIRDIVFSTDGQLIAILYGENDIRIHECITGKEITHIKPDDSQKLLFSPAMDSILTLGKIAIVWNIRNGQKIVQIPQKGIRDAAFSQDGGFLATIGTDNTTRLWDTANWENFAKYQNQELMHFVAVAPDAKEIITWNNDYAQVFRSPGRSESKIDFALNSGIRFMYSPDGNYLSQVNAGQYSATLFDINSREQILFEERHWNTAFSGNGEYYALASPEWDAHVYYLPSIWQAGHYWEPNAQAIMIRKHIRRRVSCRRGNSVHHDNSVNTVALSHHGKYLGTTSRDHTARVWESIRGREVLRLLEEVEGSLFNLVFHRNEKFVTGRGEKGFRTWEITGHRQVVELAHGDAVIGISFSKNGQYIATVSQDRTCRVWSVPDGNEVQRLQINSEFFNTRASLNHDGSKLLLNQRNILDVASGKIIGQIPQNEVNGLLVVGDNWRFAAQSRKDGSIIIIDLKTENEIAHLTAVKEPIKSIAVNENARLAAIVTGKNGFSLWSWKTGKEIKKMARDIKVRKLKFSPSGTKLVITDEDDKAAVEIWDAKRNQNIRRISQETEVTSASFGPSENHLVTTSVDFSARVWELATGNQVAQFKHDANVVTAEFSPDGMYVASAGGRSDRSVRLWFWQPEDLIAEACSRLSRDLTKDEWEQYLGKESYRSTRQIKNEA